MATADLQRLPRCSVCPDRRVHAEMIMPVAAMVLARAALDDTGWLAVASVLVGLPCAGSAGYWIRRAGQVFRGVARLDVARPGR